MTIKEIIEELDNIKACLEDDNEMVKFGTALASGNLNGLKWKLSVEGISVD